MALGHKNRAEGQMLLLASAICDEIDDQDEKETPGKQTPWKSPSYSITQNSVEKGNEHGNSVKGTKLC